jgi:SAM-dependent methyltransferase
MAQYYADKLERVREIFGAASVSLADEALHVDGRVYPIVDDVIVLLDPSQYPAAVRDRLKREGADRAMDRYAPDIQDHYTKFWTEWSGIEPHYEQEFNGYFDLVDLQSLAGKRVVDLGAGMGRWSYMLAQKVPLQEVILVDFSEAIFTARRLFAGDNRAIFFMADLLRLPFRADFTDFAMSLGVLHHLPEDCLKVVRQLKGCAPRLLVYLYYALDNKPWYYRTLLAMYTPVRKQLCKVESPRFRVAFSWFAMVTTYLPFVALGYLLKPFGLAKHVPVFNEHHWAGFDGMRHSAYDRFFTRIEQRVSRAQIQTLTDTYARVTIAPGQAYWHFLCER